MISDELAISRLALERILDLAIYRDSHYGDMFRSGHNRNTLMEAILSAAAER